MGLYWNIGVELLRSVVLFFLLLDTMLKDDARIEREGYYITFHLRNICSHFSFV